jgi:DNA polymerase/3'-5' exonuclease PolX
MDPKHFFGLKYYEDILERIPRSEIDRFADVFGLVFDKVKVDGARYEIVGSYRRGLLNSGDIDVIITSPKEEVFKRFIDKLVSENVIVEILSRGKSKCLVIARLPLARHARRVDFLFTSPEEYPFSVLYFTGSKAFNTVMRGHALKMGVSLNEHGLSKMVDKKKEEKVGHVFRDEKDIFDYLNMEYKAPNERIDGRSVVIKAVQPTEPGKTRKIRTVIKKIPNEKITILLKYLSKNGKKQ